MNTYTLIWIIQFTSLYHGIMCQSTSNSEISTSQSHEVSPSTPKTVIIEPSFVPSSSLHTIYTSAYHFDMQSSENINESELVSSDVTSSIQTSYNTISLKQSDQIISISPIETKTAFQQETSSLGNSSLLDESRQEETISTIPTEIISASVDGSTIIQSEDVFIATISLLTEMNNMSETYSSSEHASFISSNVMSKSDLMYVSSLLTEYSQVSDIYSQSFTSPITGSIIEPTPTNFHDYSSQEITSNVMYSTASRMLDTHSSVTSLFSDDSQLNMTNSIFDKQTISTSSRLESMFSQTLPIALSEHSIDTTLSSINSDLPSGIIDDSHQSDMSVYETTVENTSQLSNEPQQSASSLYSVHSPLPETIYSDFNTNSMFSVSSVLFITESVIQKSLPVSELTAYSGTEITTVSNIVTMSFSTGFSFESTDLSPSSYYIQTSSGTFSSEYSYPLRSVFLTTSVTPTPTLTESSSDLDILSSEYNKTDTLTKTSLSSQPFSTVTSNSVFLTINPSSSYPNESTSVPSPISNSFTISVQESAILKSDSIFNATPISSSHFNTTTDSVYLPVTESQSQASSQSNSEDFPTFKASSSVIFSNMSEMNSVASSIPHSMLYSSFSGISHVTLFPSFEDSSAKFTSGISEQMITTIQSYDTFKPRTTKSTMPTVDSISSMGHTLLKSIELTSSTTLTFRIIETSIHSTDYLSIESVYTPYSSIIYPSTPNTSRFVSLDSNSTSTLSTDFLLTSEFLSTPSSKSDAKLDSSSIFESLTTGMFTDSQTLITHLRSEVATSISVAESISGFSSDTRLQSTESFVKSLITSSNEIIVLLSTFLSFSPTVTTMDSVLRTNLASQISEIDESSSLGTIDQPPTAPSSVLSSIVDYTSQMFSSQIQVNTELRSAPTVFELSTSPVTSLPMPDSVMSQMSTFVSEFNSGDSISSQFSSVTLIETSDSAVITSTDSSESIPQSLPTMTLSASIESSFLISTMETSTLDTINSNFTSLTTNDYPISFTDEQLSTTTSNEISALTLSVYPTIDISSIESFDMSSSSSINMANSSDLLLTSLFTISIFTPVSSSIQLESESLYSTASIISSTTPGSTESTPQTPDQTTNNITNSDESFWVKTVLAVRKTIDISSENFRTDLEQRMAEAYSEAFERERLMQQGLFENLRRKRYTNNGEASVHIHGVSREGESTAVNVVYAVEKSGTRLRPTEAVTSLNVLSTQELAIILRQVVQSAAEPYQSVSQPTEDTDDDGMPLWLVAAITGSVGGFIVLVWLFVCVYMKCCREKKEMEKHVEPELTSIQQNDVRRESQRRHTDSNGVGTSARKPLPHQTSKSSLTKKSTAYQIKPTDEEALIETTAEPDAEEYVYENKMVTQASSLQTKHHSPRVRSPEKPVATGSTTSLSNKHEIESPSKTKKSKHPSKVIGIDGSIPGLDYTDNTDKPRLLKYQVLQSSFSDQDNEDLRERALLERQKNKERTRHKRRKQRHKDEVHPTSVLYSTMGIPSTPLPSVQVESGSPVRESKSRPVQNTLNGGLSTENLSGDESLQEARSRMHKLLDDAFSLISPRASFTENNFPRANDSQPFINKDDGLTEGAPSIRKLDRDKDEDIKHEPMYVNPFYSESSFPLETWSPYRTSDLVAMISMPNKQEPTRLGQKPKTASRPMSSKPNRRPAASFDFSETKSATTFEEDRFTTSPAKPIVIRTKPVTENESANSNKLSSNRVSSGRTTVMVSPLPKSNQNEQFEMNSLSKGGSRNGSAGKFKSRSIDRSNVDEVDVINDLDAEQSSDKLIKSLRDELGELKELYSVPNTRIERKKNRKNINRSNTEAV